MKISSITKVPEEKLIEAAQIIAESSKTSFTFGQDTINDMESKSFVDSIINLASITNNLNGEGKGIYPTFNGIGTANFFEIFTKNKRNFTSTDKIIDGIKQNKIKALIMFGDGINPDLISDEPFENIAEKLDLFVYSNHLKNKFYTSADFVLPTKTYAEQDSTTINNEGRIKISPNMIKEVKSNLMSVIEISEKLYEQKTSDIEKSKEEFINLISEDVKNVIKNELKHDLIFSDIKIDDKLFDGLFYLPGRILNRPEEITIEKEDDMNKIISSMIISIHPNDAKANNIKDNDSITIKSENGNFELVSKFKTDGEIEGFLTSTDYFGKMVSDLESSNNPDFSSAVPALKYKKIIIN